MTTHNVLAINNLELNIHLGWPDEERLQKQTVWLDVKMQFHAAPKACASDQLDDTVCYQQLIGNLRQHLAEKQFRLVEHLTHDIYDFIQAAAPKETKISVVLTKQPKQIQGLGNVTYHYGAAL